MPTASRIHLPPAHPVEQGNLEPLYALEQAAWIWHPDCPAGQQAVLVFANRFSLAEPTRCRLHVSGDQRYELSLNGGLIACGPDRGDLDHWGFASYDLELPPGEHVLEAFVTWLGEHAPAAQVTWRGGFILAAEGDLAARLDTGGDGWRVRQVLGCTFAKVTTAIPHFVGSSHIIDGAAWHRVEPEVVPAVVQGPLGGNPYGIRRDGWRLYPSPLPDQLSGPVGGGRIRALVPGGWQADQPMPEATPAADWQALVEGRAAVTVPPHTRLSVLWDLEQYQCAYPRFRLSGGRGSSFATEWAESLYEAPRMTAATADFKADRNRVAGKFFRPTLNDTIRTDGGPGRDYRTCWWRASRYILVTVATAAEPLTIDAIELRETRYPLAVESTFTSSDPALATIVPMMVRGLQMCSHETFVDCPYYEQLMYVGDTRLEMLITHVLTRDDRLVRRAIDLFNWSRCRFGTVAEHYPSRIPQQSTTYALLFTPVVLDYALWRDDAAFVRSQLPGLRANLDLFLTYTDADGLPANLPGWSFVDWVMGHGWQTGVPPTAADGLSSHYALHLLLALQSAAELERWFGDAFLAQRWAHLAARLAVTIRTCFHVPERALIADDTAHAHFSEHAQCLALLTDVLPPAEQARTFAALLETPDLAPTSIYFSHYLLETCHRFGRGDRIIAHLDYWHNLHRLGLRTPQEAPDPARSDCHAWGSHPLFHYHASLAGVRPTAPGFREVRIAPAPGHLTEIDAVLPHPRGELRTQLRFASDRSSVEATIELPPATSGVFVWANQTHLLHPGRNQLHG